MGLPTLSLAGIIIGVIIRIMVPKRYSSEAIILFRRNYGEADRIVSVLSKDYGKLSFMAKSVRKPKSRKRGSLEVFSVIKFAAARGKSLDIVTEVEMIDDMASIRSDIKRVTVAYYFMETVDKLTREEEAHQDVYFLVLRYLGKLKTTEKLRTLRKDFVKDIVTTLGFWPEGKPLNDPDAIMEQITEREMTTKRVGKQIIA